MTGILIKSIPVSDTLTLHLYDASRKIAGDRWQVNLTARMPLPVDAVFSDADTADPTAADLKAALGDPVIWEIQKQRNFIDDGQKEAVLKELLTVFETHSRPYLSHPAFARKFILKQYQAYAKRFPRQSG